MADNNENKALVPSENQDGQSGGQEITSHVKKQGLSQKVARGLLSEDAKLIFDSIYKSIISPAVKKLAVETFRAFVYRGKPSNDYDVGDEYTDYSGYSGGKSSKGGSLRIRRDFADIQFDSKKDAEIVLGTMKNYLKKNSVILVADYYKIAHQKPEPTYYNWGWTNLNATYIYSYSNRGETSWGIHLPEPIYVEREN